MEQNKLFVSLRELVPNRKITGGQVDSRWWREAEKSDWPTTYITKQREIFHIAICFTTLP